MARNSQIKYFSEKEIETIINTALEVLESSGIYIPNKKAKELLKNEGAKEREENYLTIPRDLVQKVISDVPPRFKLWNQTGTDFLQLEIGNTFYGPGSDLQYTVDLETGKTKKTEVEDIARNIALIDRLPQFDFLMSTGLPCDVASEDIYKKVFEIMVLNSNKPIIGTATNLEDIKKMHEVAIKVAGSQESFSEKPFYLAYLEPVSPLKIEEDIANKIMFCSEKDIPMLFAAGANISVQAPGTCEGAVIQGTAEALSGLVLANLVNPKAKFVFGANSADFDAKEGIVSYGGPGWSKTMAYYAEIARRLNLPVWGAAGCTDSNKIDAQTGFEAALSILMAELSTSTLVHDIGYLSHGDLNDPRNYVFNSEIIGRVRWLSKRGELEPERVKKEIEAVVNGEIGTFLESGYTFEKHGELYAPQSWIDRSNHAESKESLGERLRKEVNLILGEHKPVVEGEIKTKRKEEEKKKEKIKIEKENKKSLEELFKDSPGKPGVIKDYLTEKLEEGSVPKELYSKLIKSFEKSIEGTDENVNLVFLLAYANLFENSSEPLLKLMENNEEKTPLILATVESDLHYVGKNIVSPLAGVSGYNVIDKGIDAKTGELINAIIENDSSLIGLSALLTTTRDNMKKTIKCLKALGMKDQVGVIVGGAVIDEAYAKSIEADSYRKNAGDVGEALNEIKDYFLENAQRKSVKDGSFKVIGESINSISKKVKKALEEKDEETILEIARKQEKNGAKYIDIAVSHLGGLEEQKEAMEWVVKLLQKNIDTPLCLDSDDYKVIKAGLKVYETNKSSPLINSVTLEEERLNNMVRLAKEHDAQLVFQAAEGQTLDMKISIVNQFLEYAQGEGISEDRVFVDPGLETMAHNPESAKLALQTVSTLKDKYPQLHFTIGLTNIGYGIGDMKRMRALQKAFLQVGKRVGLDSAITHPTIFKEEFKDTKQAMSESLEFIAGVTSNIDYAKQIEKSVYELI
ncbi:MAG: trimethylamine methyltransferase family protein [Nanoarchaeota archaeon]|nr:trimethylamine methyltransferase family protein [Nanoarchaeota archaeon]